jgi:hypothetical protein
MKLTQGILGCALAAGLMAFASGQAQANDVIDNALYLPLNLKASVTFTINNKPKKVSLSNKILIVDILELPKDTKLMVSDDTGDVWAFSKENAPEDLTADGVLTITNTQIGSGTVKGIAETDTGTTEIDFYDEPQFDTGLDKVASEDNSDNWFEITGTYTLTHSEAAPKKGLSKVSDSFSAKGLTGSGFFDEVDAEIVPLTNGSVSAKGSGSLEVP